MNYVEKFFKEIVVYDCDLTKMRIGNAHDGGYVLLKELCQRAGFICSFGIGDDMEFERSLVHQFPNIYGYLFDPTIEKLPHKHSNLYFRKEGLDYAVGFMQSKKNEIQNGAILKMDIEWNEWRAFTRFGIDILSKFDQIVVEFHIVHAQPREGLTPYFTQFYQSVFEEVNEGLFKQYYQVLKKLNEIFYIFHIHANNSLPVNVIQGHVFPPLLELSFVRKDLISANPSKCSFPIEGLDFPNKTDRPDIENYYPIRGKVE